MSWFLTVIFLVVTLTFHTPSEASHEKNHPSAVVVGTVYCDTCFQEDFSHTSHFISGASVGVECKDGSSTEQSFKAQVKTNSHGQFKVLLPFSVSKHVKKIEGCSVKLISSSEPYCAVASSATSSSLHLKARKQGTHIFSAGFFTFKPLKQPTLCNQKPSIQNSKKLNSQKFSFPHTDELEFPSPSQVDPTIPALPPVPRIPYLPPLPQLPPLPPLPIGVPGLPGLPGIPVSPPVAVKTSSVSSNSKTSKNEQLGDNKKVAHPDDLPPVPTIPYLPPLPQLPPLPPLPIGVPGLPGLPGIPVSPPVAVKTSFVSSNSKTSKNEQLGDNKKVVHPDDLPLVPTIPYLPPLPQLPPLPPLPIGVPGLPGLPGIPVSPPVAVKTSYVSSNSKTSKNEQLGDNKKVAHPDDLPPVPTIPYLPPLPQLPPLPPLPIGVPGLPGIPGSPPVAVKTSSVSSNSKTSKNEQLGDNKEVAHPDDLLPPLFPPIIPNPFQPPPLIPNPFQPPPAPLIPNLPPLPGSPPAGPAPLIPNLPPIPFFTPSPSPPPPILPFLPPFPFPLPLPPVPRIPGIPPASSSKQSTSP